MIVLVRSINGPRTYWVEELICATLQLCTAMISIPAWVQHQALERVLLQNNVQIVGVEGMLIDMAQVVPRTVLLYHLFCLLDTHVMSQG